MAQALYRCYAPMLQRWCITQQWPYSVFDEIIVNDTTYWLLAVANCSLVDWIECDQPNCQIKNIGSQHFCKPFYTFRTFFLTMRWSRRWWSYRRAHCHFWGDLRTILRCVCCDKKQIFQAKTWCFPNSSQTPSSKISVFCRNLHCQI